MAALKFGSRARLAIRGRDLREATVHAINAEQTELAAVVGIDDHHQRQHQHGGTDQRAQAGKQAPSPAGIALRT